MRSSPCHRCADECLFDTGLTCSETYSSLVTMASSIVLHAIQSDQPTNIFGMTSTSNRNNYYNLFKGEQT